MASQYPSICEIGQGWHQWLVGYVETQYDLFLDRIANLQDQQSRILRASLGISPDPLSVEEKRNLSAKRQDLRNRRLEPVR